MADQPRAVEGPALWEQRPDESNKAHAACMAWLEMGPNRSYEAVAVELRKSSSLMRRWGFRFDWRARELAWDEYRRKLVHDAEIEAMKARAVERANRWADRREEFGETLWAAFIQTRRRLDRLNRRAAAADENDAEGPTDEQWAKIERSVKEMTPLGEKALAINLPRADEVPVADEPPPDPGGGLPPGMSAQTAEIMLNALFDHDERRRGGA